MQQQDLARQIKALKRLGCRVIYPDTASGRLQRHLMVYDNNVRVDLSCCGTGSEC
jgi:hypothetical protein